MWLFKRKPVPVAPIPEREATRLERSALHLAETEFPGQVDRVHLSPRPFTGDTITLIGFNNEWLAEVREHGQRNIMRVRLEPYEVLDDSDS